MYMGYIMKRNSWKVVFNAAMGYILDIRIFEASSWPISPQSLHSVQYSVTLKKGKEIFQSAREFNYFLFTTNDTYHDYKTF